MAWKARKKRKPLILRGARQVGKTTLVKNFSQSFRYFISLNLEKSADCEVFRTYEDVNLIVEALFLKHDISPSKKNETLLFIDEIQELPEAIQALRYFYEEQPELNVIAAGSLLEFSMKDVESMPVGRIEYLYLHPLNFREYLEALGHGSALEEMARIPISQIAHSVLMTLFHRYAIIGGMPEVVNAEIELKSIADLPRVYESIWTTYKEDVEKYATNETNRRVIKHIIDVAHLYADQRIKFQNFGNSSYKSREVGEALRQLNDSRIIKLIYPTTDVQPPVKPDIKKSPRLQFLDTGLLNYTLKIQADMLGMKDLSHAYRGAIIPHLIFQELISIQSVSDSKMHFWVREKRQSSSEVDIVLAYKSMLIPIEVKSGVAGKLRSLHQFMDRVDHPYAIRVYGGSFRVEKLKTIAGKHFYLMNLPYYLGTMIPSYMQYLVENHNASSLSDTAS